MSDNNNSESKVSFDYSNKQLSEFPEDLFKYKSSLINLDISANPLLNLDKTIKALTEFNNLKKLKINIETGEEAKKLIDALPNLLILNDHPIHEEEEDNIENENESKEILNDKNDTNNINSNLIEQEIAQLNYNSIISNKEEINESNNINIIKNIEKSNINSINKLENNKLDNNKLENNNFDNNKLDINKLDNNNLDNNNNASNNNINNSLEKKMDLKEENEKFEFILNKIKEYSEITKEKYDLIMNEYNKLMTNNIKNTLDICSFFNKVLINLIKDAQEQNNVKISSIKPLLEAQTQN